MSSDLPFDLIKLISTQQAWCKGHCCIYLESSINKKGKKYLGATIMVEGGKNEIPPKLRIH